MELLRREDLPKTRLPGRIIQKTIGRDASVASRKITMGFAQYSAEAGPMTPHQHAEEAIYVISSHNGWVRFGEDQNRLCPPVPLSAGMTLHFPELEWHVFEYEEGGHVDIVFFYGQVDNIRPEEIAAGRR